MIAKVLIPGLARAGCRGRMFARSEWIHVRLALVEARDGFKDLLPG
jgi:hypothetical protein